MLILVFSESMMRMAVSVGRDQLGSVGVCFGKFTKTGKFKLHITALDHLAQYAKVIGKRVLRWKDAGCLCFDILAQDLD